MASIPKKVTERFSKAIGKFQNVLKIAKDRDLNESDTVSILNDILAEVFGYDKYLEVTSEFSVRGTYCDLAIKIDNKIQFLIEAKAVGIELKDNHLRQVIDYGANYGVQWVILTNGIRWEVYKIRFEKPINYDLVCSFNFTELSAKNADDQEKLFIICKEGLSKDAREDFHEKTQSINRFMIGAVILNEVVMDAIRRELKKITPGLKVENDEIKTILENEVIKRDVIEGEDATKAQNRVRKFYGKLSKKSREATNEPVERQETDKVVSLSDQLLKSVGENPANDPGSAVQTNP